VCGHRARWLLGVKTSFLRTFKMVARRQETILPHQLMLPGAVLVSTTDADSNRRQPVGYYPKALSVSCRCHINDEKNYKANKKNGKPPPSRIPP
jgi:hypothetical protein